MKPAVFWDRDGTLIEDPGYLDSPDGVVLLPGAADALRRLRDAGFENIVVTNQSGVARGLLDEPTVHRIHDRLQNMLAERGASLDAFYYCPYLNGDEAVVEQYRQDSELRKPRPGMLLQAALERKLDLAGSWSVGDNLRDAEAGRAAGCRTILLSTQAPPPPVGARSAVDFVAGSLQEAVDIILKYTSTARPQAASSEPASGPPERDQTAILQEMLGILQRMDRRARSDDFNSKRLAALIMQVFAIAALIWALFALSEPVGTQYVRLAYATVFQLMTLTLWTMSRRN